MKRKPAVLLLSPGILKWTDLDFGLPHLVSMGGWVREHTGVRVEILDLNYEGGDHRDLERTLDDLGPFLVIGIATYSSFDRMRTLAVARFLREAYPGVPIVTGGYHASAVPDDVMGDDSPFDSVILSEGERPLQRIVETLLGGGTIEPVYTADLVQKLDDLPPMQWDLLDRYWPRAHLIGRKLQVYLSRGCPYRCTFCMERSKGTYFWRAHSPERAVDELARLGTFTDLSRWVVNLADPLFGFRRRWRREVLEGIARRGLFPRQYWTLTRSDDLDDTDIELLGKARFSIGIGLESGSPTMLRLMDKGNTPDKYLAAVTRLARLSQKHGLHWATNVIVGHPGETPETMAETRDFLQELFLGTPRTNGWLSIDPFRLYPGSHVFENHQEWSERTGAVFHHLDWWRAWYDQGFLAQHLEPSSSLSYAERVRFMYDTYRPMVEAIGERFQGDGTDIDRVYAKSIEGQIAQLAPEVRDAHLERGRKALGASARMPDLRVPIGLNLKDPWVRRREEAVRRLLHSGVLRSEALTQALIEVSPERFMSAAEAEAILLDRPLAPAAEGLLPAGIGITAVATALEALEPDEGSVVLEATAQTGWVTALLAHLVGPMGTVVAMHPGDGDELARRLEGVGNVELRCTSLGGLFEAKGPFDRIFVGAGLPRFPHALGEQLAPGGRAVAFIGPRFRPQDLSLLTPGPDGLDERRVARFQVPIVAGPRGWIRRPVVPESKPGPVRFSRRLAPALCAHILAHLDLGRDAASLHDPRLPARPWAEALAAAYQAAPGRLMIQVCAMPFRAVDEWIEALRTRPPRALSDAAGVALIEAVLAAVDAEREPFEARWKADAEDARVRAARVGSAVTPLLDRLRQQMWANQPESAPALVIMDVPAMGSRGRATTADGVRLVAVSLAEGTSHVLCQVLHEEMHAITDPLVRAEVSGSQDTRVGSDGWALHAALEATAVGATAAILQARAPELMTDFETWRVRVGA